MSTQKPTSSWSARPRSQRYARRAGRVIPVALLTPLPVDDVHGA